MNSFWKSFFASLLAFIVAGGALMVFFIFSMVVILVVALEGSEGSSFSPKEHSILKIDMSVPIVERSSSNPLDLFDYDNFKLRQQTTLLDAVTMVGQAANDPRIDGIYLSVPMGIPSSMSTLYELRQALSEFRQTGKFVVAYGDVYSQGGYYLCSVADRVMLNPEGVFEWRGIASNVLFYKGLFDKLGVKPELIRHGRFKSAGEPFIRESLSDENRLQIESMIGSMWGYIVEQVAADRSLDVDSLNSYASRLAIESPLDAQRLGLVDSLYYRDQMRDHLCRLSGVDTSREPRLISFDEYRKAGKAEIGNPMSINEIALIYAEGDMVDAGDKERHIVGNVLAAELSDLRRNEDVKAVVIRVNSPGGSALAAEVIAREVDLLSRAKPVVISMGSYAASGGYYMAAPADVIVASPLTLTGSIGVFGLMFDVSEGAREKLGLNAESVSTGPSSDMGNVFRPMSSAEHAYIQRGVDRVYNRFIDVVSSGRDMSHDSVETLASGRVWTGQQAVANRLADRTGTLSDAIQVAMQQAGLTVDEFRLTTYPGSSSSTLDLILGSLVGQVSSKILGRVGVAGTQDNPLIMQIATQSAKAAQLINSVGVRTQMPYEIEFTN